MKSAPSFLLAVIQIAYCFAQDRPGVQNVHTVEVGVVYDQSFKAVFNGDDGKLLTHVSHLMYGTSIKFDRKTSGHVNTSISLVSVTELNQTLGIQVTKESMEDLSKLAKEDEKLKKLDVVLFFTKGNPVDKGSVEEYVRTGNWCTLEEPHIGIVRENGASLINGLRIARQLAIMMGIGPDPQNGGGCSYHSGYIMGKQRSRQETHGYNEQESLFSLCSLQAISTFISKKVKEYPYCFKQCHKDMKMDNSDMTEDRFCAVVQPSYEWKGRPLSECIVECKLSRFSSGGIDERKLDGSSCNTTKFHGFCYNGGCLPL